MCVCVWQVLCDGHYRDMQLLLLEQPTNPQSFNVLALCVQSLRILVILAQTYMACNRVIGTIFAGICTHFINATVARAGKESPGRQDSSVSHQESR